MGPGTDPPRVPVWNLRTPQGAPSYVVVPGNVGTDSTLRDILDRISIDPDPQRSLLDQGAGR
ncbi:hypothetical protein [Micromonospora sp. ATA51]|uniref:hypothetical protein n=1 Tax=Micromonospora sp. ATA51 TaxID=2806098 RepID=UPI001A62DD29|nr:hypothetical protein [Micromonospora sp. ATA51]MBM0224722.1 hypothetical protein [Micromonospora sp. ATA51]